MAVCCKNHFIQAGQFDKAHLLVLSAVVNVGLVLSLLGLLDSLRLLSLLVGDVSSDHGGKAEHGMLVVRSSGVVRLQGWQDGVLKNEAITFNSDKIKP